MAELRRLQKERKAPEAEALAQAAQAYLLAVHRDLAALGFEFSTQRFNACHASLTPLRKQQLLPKALTAEPKETMPAAA
jgi:hypothetical protein